MRRTTHIQRTSFLLTGFDLEKVLHTGIQAQVEGEDLGRIKNIILIPRTEFQDEVGIDVVYEKEVL